MEKSKEIIEFVDENIIAKSKTSEEFTRNLEVVKNYLELKGPIDDEILEYLNLLNCCSTEIMSLRKKGVNITTENFFPRTKKETKKPKEKKKEVTPSYSYHYPATC